jgi:BolA protein
VKERRGINRRGIMSTVKARIEAKLQAAFQPVYLAVIDESAQHRGHAGHREGGETHFRVEIRATQFVGQSRIDRSRAVHRVLAEELAGPVHALAISADIP